MMVITSKRKNFSIFIAVVLSIAAIAVFTSMRQSITHAADVSKFDPGNIMSDAVMSNKSAMNVQQIQAFLNSKNACNNTNVYMAGWYPHLQYTIRNGKFVCMAQDTFGGKSAAQIIWQVAQDYSINPQFLIVLLEKEQGLVSDTWPNHVQYRTAAGFGCPDTAPCDSQYFGLENQLRQAAGLFRTVLNGGWSNYPVGYTYVQYNPNSACGGSVIHIQNRATSALYRYTPYQPNQSALNAGYGSGDSCGAYGNRNTWMLFNDWFGSTQGSTFIELEDPRWMQVKQSGAQKVDIFSGKKIDGRLEQGRQIRFVDKVLFNNTWYLRTEFNYNDGASYGIPQNELQDIPYQSISPKWLTLKSNGNKSYPGSRTNTGESLAAGTSFRATSTTSIDGNTYYRTEYDEKNGLNKGVHTQFVDNFNPIPLETPRYFCASNDISSQDVTSGSVNLKSGYKFMITKKTTINGVWYYQAQEDEGTTTFIDSRVLNEQCYQQFQDPRTMKLTKDTDRINLKTGQVYDTLKKGMVLELRTKIQLNGVWYYRTAFSTQYNEDAVIPAKSFSEI